MSGQVSRTMRDGSSRRTMEGADGAAGESGENSGSAWGFRAGLESLLVRCRRLVETLEEGMLWRAEGTELRATFVGTRLLERLGYPAGWWLSDADALSAQLHPADRDRILDALRLAREHGGRAQFEHRILAADGRAHWFESSVTVVRGAFGAPSQVRGLSTLIPDLEITQSAERARARHSSAIAQLAAAIHAAEDAPAVIEAALRAATTTLGLNFGEIYQLSPDGETLILRGAVGWSVETGAHSRIRVSAATELGEALRAGHAFLERDGTGGAFARRASLQIRGVASGLSVAISGERGPCGVLALYSRAPRVFTPDEWHFARVVADLASVGLDQPRPLDMVDDCHALLDDVMAASTDAVFVKDAQGRYALVNDAAAVMLGRDRGAILGRQDGDLLEPGSARARATSDHAHMLAGRDTVSHSSVGLGPMGRSFAIARGAFRDRTARIRGLVGVVRASERVETPASRPMPQPSYHRADETGPRRILWRDPTTVLNAAPAAIAVWRAPDMLCTIANPRHANLLGAEGAVGVSAREAFAVLGRHALLEAFDTVLATGQPVTGIEVCLPSIAGRPAVTMTYSLDALHDVDGTILGVVSAGIEGHGAGHESVGHDGTSERDIARERTELLAIVAHELGSPLAAVMLTTESLLQTREVLRASRVRKAVEAVQRCTSRMIRLAADMRDVATLTAGRLQVRVRPFDVSVVVDDAVTTLRPLVESASLRLIVEPVEPGLRAVCDRERIGQVLCNLVGNATKFTPTGGRITLRVEAREHELVFSVTDTGRGLTPLQAARVFDRYWQADDATRRGSGLGLYICRGVIEAHGGRIWVESTEGRGSTFRFTVPRAPV